MDDLNIRDITSDALRYWERRWLIYNLVLAAYCAAYVPDVFAQLSGFGERWRRSRWTVFAVGCGLAAVIARGIVKDELA